MKAGRHHAMDRPDISKELIWPSSSSTSSISRSRSRSRSRYWLPPVQASGSAASASDHCEDSLLQLASETVPYELDSQDTQLEAPNEAMLEIKKHADEWNAREAIDIRKRETELEELREMEIALDKAVRECSGLDIKFNDLSLLLSDDETIVASLSNVVTGGMYYYIGGCCDVRDRWLGAERRGRPLINSGPQGSWRFCLAF